MKTLSKVMRIGKGPDGDIFIKATVKDGKLSISGVIGPTANGNCRGGCGQIDMEFMHRNPAHDDKRYFDPIPPDQIRFAPGWNAERWFDLLEIWHDWHLNDMRAGCEHQREWNTKKEITVTDYKWSKRFHDCQKQAADGKMSPEDYENWHNIVTKVFDATIGLNHPRYPFPNVRELIDEGWIEKGKTETKTAGWVNHNEHPEGLLSKPCPVCGYKYGSEWKREELPQWVVDKLEGFPVTDKTPAWV